MSDTESKNKNAPTSRIVNCPRCRRPTRYDETNASRPFCSERCKNDDIIAWAQEDYKVAGKPVLDIEELDPADEKRLRDALEGNEDD